MSWDRAEFGDLADFGGERPVNPIQSPGSDPWRPSEGTHGTHGESRGTVPGESRGASSNKAINLTLALLAARLTGEAKRVPWTWWPW